MKARMLKRLKEQSEYLSGQLLATEFGVSRTAVWKLIKQLQLEGYQIEAVPNKGYYLIDHVDILSADELSSIIEESWIARQIEYVEAVDSTNTRAKLLAEQGALSGTLVVADTQSAGKGRRGRSWVSPKGSGIWMSLILRPKIRPASASMLTLVAALALCRGIESVTGLSAAIKWPNDIVVNGKKIAGILTEMSSEIDHIHYLVIGMGINVNTKKFPDNLDFATSCFLQLGYESKRSQIIAVVMKELKLGYNEFLQTGDLSACLLQYQQKLVNKDQEVEVIMPQESYQGVAIGIAETGELLVRCPDGEIKKVVSGEVSVRGIYGYI